MLSSLAELSICPCIYGIGSDFLVRLEATESVVNEDDTESVNVEVGGTLIP